MCEIANRVALVKAGLHSVREHLGRLEGEDFPLTVISVLREELAGHMEELERLKRELHLRSI